MHKSSAAFPEMNMSLC